MRILLATDWNRGRGGAEAYVTWLRTGLEAAGDEVRLLTSSAGSAGDGRAEYVAFGTGRIAAQAALQVVNPFAVARARRAVREFRPEVAFVNMFAHHLSPAFVHALGAVPLVIGVSDYKCICPMGTKLLPDGTLCTRRAGVVCLESCMGMLHWLRDRPRYALLRSALRRAGRILACSEWVRGTLAADGIGSEVLLLPVPAPLPTYVRDPADEPTFLFCGRLDTEKGVPLLIRAFARVRRAIPEARLRIAGRGPLEPELRRLAAELDLGGAVSFVGWIEGEAMDAELARAWASVAPSLYAEPLGLVAPEAIVRGVPVVASAIGGFSETVAENRTGLLFRNGDERGLADCLLSVARGDAFPDRRVAPEFVAETARRHSLVAHVERMREILGSVRGGP